MKFKFCKSDQYVILTNSDDTVCYVAISSCGHSPHELSGLYLYHGCKHDQVENDIDGHLLIDGIDLV
jgi:hypothetical protein